MKLLTSGRIGKLSLKNRVVMAAMGIGALAEPDGRLSDRVINYYVARARGGAGLIVTAGFRSSRTIEQPPGVFFGRRLMIDNDVYVAQLNKLAEAVHDYGAKIFIQLTAGSGRNLSPDMLKLSGAVGSSSNPAFFDSNIRTRPLTVDEVGQLVQSFELAAQLANAAGIDGIELDCHGAYLFDEFTTSLWNKRTDKYGGDLDGRLRFSCEAIDALKRGGGPDFPISVKFALTHYIPGGREIAEGVEIARRFEAAGIDALTIDAGCYEVRYRCNPPTTLPMGCNVELAAAVKEVATIPVIAVGKLGDPELAERVLQEGKADFIALGRPLLADPEWTNKVRDDRRDDIRPCIGDFEGCHRRTSERKYLSCSVNPECGTEREFAPTKAEKTKSMLVVGGGPAGMEAAMVAAARGHSVTLWEKGDALGGHLTAASIPPFKQEYAALLRYLNNQTKKLGVGIQLHKEATISSVVHARPEVVFVATGSTPAFPPLPGVEAQNVIQAEHLLLDKRETGASVVVIGGGMVGCETALHLAQQGRRVVVVEMLERAMGDMYSISRTHLTTLLLERDVQLLFKAMALEITPTGVVVADGKGKRVLECDTVVLAVGLKSNDGLVEDLKGLIPEVYAIGDCVRPRKVIDAIWDGFRVARLV